MKEVALILFSRAPRPGYTKSRLAADMGTEAACAFHVCCLQDLIETCDGFKRHLELNPTDLGAPVAAACHLFITPPGSIPQFHRSGVVWPAYFNVHPQSGADLGERMASAFRSVLEGAPEGRAALLLGTDLPLLQERHLLDALEALISVDVVLGGTEDGGYYLIGMKHPHTDLFDIDHWGGPKVLENTLALAAARGLGTARIGTLPDVDTLVDLEKVRNHPLFPELSNRRAGRFVDSLLIERGVSRFPGTQGTTDNPR